jgi:hypothetical protein
MRRDTEECRDGDWEKSKAKDNTVRREFRKRGMRRVGREELQRNAEMWCGENS